MDDRTLHGLQFPRVLELIAERCLSRSGSDAAHALRPACEASGVRAMLEETDEFTRLLGAGERVPLAAFEDPGPWLEDIRRRGGALEGERFLAIASLLHTAAAVARFLDERRERLPRLSARMAGADLLRPLAADIRRVLNERGEVRDDASPELASTRARLRGLRGEIRRLLERVMGEHPDAIQENLVVQRRERYVIPAKTSFRRSFEGVIQDRSSSGETLFVEPLPAVALNNALTEAREIEQEEIARLMRELTAGAMAGRGALESLVARLAGLDLTQAKTRLGLEWRGARARESAQERIALREARHPLLAAGAGAVAAEDVVPIDVTVGGAVRQLVITGPNTGGKTVALKTVGLCVALHQCGVHVPAAPESELPVVRTLFADIGDEQDLQQNLSTFSGHMSRVSAAVREAGEGALLLLDELGSGTDPAEGSAIGVAVLEHLTRSGALAIITTHHDALKHYAYASSAAENASVEFDPVDLAPTYRIRMGAAGPSNAMVVAERMGLPAEVLERAREMLDGGAVQMDRLMARLADQEARLRERERGLAAREAELHAAEVSHLHERWVAESQRRKEANELLKRVRLEADDMIAAVREAEDVEAAKRVARERIHAMREEATEALPPPPAERVPQAEAAEVKVGDTVRLSLLGRTGRVRAMHGGAELTVEVDGKALRVPARSVEPVKGAVRARRPKVVVTHEAMAHDRDFSTELHLRGLRAEEAVEALDRYLNDAAVLGVGSVRIVHGKGSGVLSRAIAEHLEGHALVASFAPARPEEGGWGVTNVELARR